MTDSPKSTNPQSILIIDDDENAAKLASVRLERAGYTTLHAPDGETGLKKVQEDPPDLILLDLMMPGISGFEVCKELKGSDETKEIPIIILSSQRDRSQVMKALEQGANDFVVKPLDAQVLIHKLKTLLPQEEAGEEEKSDKPVEEKREFVRLSEEIEAVIELPLRIVDISEGGLALLSDSAIGTGKVLTMNSPFFKEVLEMENVPVRVSYCDQEGEDRPYRIGAEFVGVGENERRRIRQYIFKKQAQRVKVK